MTAGRFYPSSKICSGCGVVKAKLALSERTCTCAVCGLVIGRDVNAARNLLKLAGQDRGSCAQCRAAGSGVPSALGCCPPRAAARRRPVSMARAEPVRPAARAASAHPVPLAPIPSA